MPGRREDGKRASIPIACRFIAFPTISVIAQFKIHSWQGLDLYISFIFFPGKTERWQVFSYRLIAFPANSVVG
jgi:hypothetical protein